MQIPLISNDEFHLYHPIPLPFQYNSDSFVIISSETDNLALSSDSERFFTLSSDQWKSCKQITTFHLCKGNQPLHFRVRSNMCEILLLTKQRSKPLLNFFFVLFIL